MTYFTRTATTAFNQFQQIQNAYALNGVEAPNRAGEIKARINAGAQSVRRVAGALAADALESDASLDEWYEDALEQIKEAQAREALAAAFNEQYEQIVRAAGPRLLNEAVTALSPAFDKVAAEFAAAAKKLPAGDRALDAETNLDNNSGKALTTVRTGLAYFAVMAQMFQTSTPGDTSAPHQIFQLLPIIELPEARVEQIRSSLGEDVTTLNESALTGTRAIRRLANTGRTIKSQTRDLDLILVDVARGLHDGASIKLATPSDLGKRTSNLRTAFDRRTVREGENKMVSL